MRPLSGKDVCDILMKHGFVQVRQRGSHIIMQKQMKDSTTTVPVPNHKELKLGTLRSIIRQSKLSKTDFE
ncbi:MAG: type II toxin-antitoxin system HicA family toxin [Saprospiraceae bacterium]|uniref:Type II toxin-antitoxin system HicA family toxin n=1 Tax=Candidatus Opimibacter skivensis TaxID=2982028 RepID=A0A9D7XRQ6_9BACT|nr:type II toxin-antitoxin system HicA family toxin [Candidatus Opimibacter skivensis]